MQKDHLNLAFIDPGLRKAPFFLELRHHLPPHVRCLYYSRRTIVRGYIRSSGAPLFPKRTDVARRQYEISDADLRTAIGKKEQVLREAKALKNARWLLAEIADFLDRERIGAIMVWNGSNLRGALAIHLARQRGLPVIFAEHGYLPDTMQIDRQGVNFDASISALAACGAAGMLADPALDAALDKDIACYKAGKPMRVMDACIPAKYHRDLRTFAIRRVEGWLKRRLMREVGNLGHRLLDQAKDLPGRYVLLPFQVRKDSQLILHSPLVGNDMPRVLELLHRALPAVDPELRLVVKFHPRENPTVQVRYRELLKRYPDVVFVSRTPVHQLIDKAAAVVTVNSTVGFEALLYDKPVVALGRNFYTVPGLVEVVTRIDELPDALARALTRPVDTQRRRAFLRYVHARFLTFGMYHDFSERSLSAVAGRVVALLAMPPAAQSVAEATLETVEPGFPMPGADHVPAPAG